MPENRYVRLVTSELTFIIIVSGLATLVMIYPIDSGVWLLLRLIFGITSLFLLPGFCVLRTLIPKEERRPIKTFVFSLLIGTCVSILMVMLLQILSHLMNVIIDFKMILPLFSFLLVVSLSTVYFTKKRTSLKFYLYHKPQLKISLNKESLAQKNIPKQNILLALICFIFLIVRIYFYPFATSPTVDGEYYLHSAEKLLMEGRISSSIIEEIDINTAIPFRALGFTTHPGLIILLGLFFLMIGPTYLAAKLLTTFYAFLIMMLVYLIVRDISNERTATIAFLLAALHPLLITYSIVLWSGEIISTCLSLFSIYLFITGCLNSKNRNLSISYSIITGLSLGATNLVIYSDAMIAFAVISFFVLNNIVGRINFIKSAKRDVAPLTKKETWLPILMLLITFVVWYSVRNLNTLRDYIIFRNYGGLEAYGATGSIESQALFIDLPSLEDFYPKLNNFFNQMCNYASPLLSAFAFLALLVHLRKWRITVPLASFPLLKAFAFAFFVQTEKLTVPLPHLYDRFFVSSTIFIIILASLFISSFFTLLKAKDSGNMVDKYKLPKLRIIMTRPPLKKTVGIPLLIIGIVLFSYFVSYSEIKGAIRKLERRDSQNWYSTFEWIENNTNTDDLLMGYGFRAYTWFTKRPSIEISNKVAGNITKVISLIKQYNVSYLIVDTTTVRNCYALRWYDAPLNAPPGFEPVYMIDNPRVVIYRISHRILNDYILLEAEDFLTAGNNTQILADQGTIRWDDHPLSGRYIIIAPNETASYTFYVSNRAHYRLNLRWLNQIGHDVAISIDDNEVVKLKGEWQYAQRWSDFNVWNGPIEKGQHEITVRAMGSLDVSIDSIIFWVEE